VIEDRPQLVDFALLALESGVLSLNQDHDGFRVIKPYFNHDFLQPWLDIGLPGAAYDPEGLFEFEI